MEMQALLWGLISAVSLPLGAVTILFWKPKETATAILMAFGGGALLAALTIDLVGSSLEKGHFFILAAGCIIGGIFYEILNQTINANGGFLRKASTTMTFLKRVKVKKNRKVLQLLSQVDIFRMIPVEEITSLIFHVHFRTYKKGTTLFRQDEPADALFIIENGSVEIVDVKQNMAVLATINDSEIFGEMALLEGRTRNATAIAKQDTRVLVILKDDFDFIISHSARAKENIQKLVEKRLTDKASENHSPTSLNPEQWAHHYDHASKSGTALPTPSEVKEEAHKHSGAPLAIWLGILLDGIPESLVIGSSMIHANISWSLIAGLFLSNYPEALSSSVGMRQQGNSFFKVLMMWTSIMLITGIGAYFGNIFFVGVDEHLFSLVEGIAAGAMLVMIAETMLPEAFIKGGSVVGLSTLAGFLAAIFFSQL